MSEGLAASYDVVVVGARCAGAATARLLAAHGLSTLLLERGQPDADTLSTLALMRAGVMQLVRWGLLPKVVELGAPAVRRTSFHYPDESIEVEIEARNGVDALFAPRRFLLDPLLCQAARDAGATVRHGTAVVDVLRDRDRVVGVVARDSSTGTTHEIRAGVVVGADGSRSTMARLVGATELHRGQHASGVLYGFFADLPTAQYRWYFGPGVTSGCIPTNDALTLVFAGCSRSRFTAAIARDTEQGFLDVIDEVDRDLAARVRAARRVGRLSGTAGQLGYMRRASGPGWMLVGDAGYFRDPITAHGITDALRDAGVLARAVASGTQRAMDDYQQIRDSLALPFFRISDEVASHDWTIDRVKALHRLMSKEMRREEQFLAEQTELPG